MPIGAENIGTAYVRVLVDGEKFGQSVEDQINDLDWKKVARKGSTQFQEEWEKERAKAPNQRGMRDSIAGPLVRGNWLTNEFFRKQGGPWQEFRMNLEKEFSKAGVRAGDNLEAGMLAGMDFDSLVRKMKNLTPELVKAQKELDRELLAEQTKFGNQYDREWTRMLEEAHRANAVFNREQRNLLNEAYRDNAEFNRRVNRLWVEQEVDFERHLKDRQRAVDSLNESYDQILADTKRLEKGERLALGSKRSLIRALEDYRTGMKQAGASTDGFEIDIVDLDRRLRTLNPGINRTNTRIGRFADLAGRAFGKGSRNDFINFAGSMVRGMINILQVIPRLVGKIMEIGQSVKFAFDESMRNSGSVFRASMAAIIASLETGGAALAGFAAIAIGIVALIGPLVSIFLALAGAITAVVASITFGLIGAVAALAGALIPLAAGIGVVVAAFVSMDKEAKKALSQDFKPVVSAFKELGSIAAEELFKGVGDSAATLANVLKQMEPMVRGIASALNGVFRRAVNSLNSPQFAAFLDIWTRFLPNAVEKIGNAIVNFGIGLGGVFTGAIPLIREFVGWLEDISERFAEWATSQEGQKEIKAFLRDAAESAKALGGFLSSAAGFIGALFSAGRGSGDSLLGSLAGTLDRWAKFIRENPDAVGKFFTNAEEVAKDIGRIVEGVGKLIDKLDNDGTRAAAQGLLGGIRKGLEGIAIFISPALGAMLALMAAVGRVRDAFNKLPNTYGQIRAKTKGVTDAIVGFFSSLPGRIRSALTPTPGAVNSPFQRAKDLVGKIPGAIAAQWDKLPNEIKGALSLIPAIITAPFTASLSGISQIPGKIVGFFQGLGARIVSAIGSININWPTPPGWLQDLWNGAGFKLASGGVVHGPVRALIGEAGPEAVVPLNRPLSQVDPAVRWLSAIAQGKAVPMASGGVAGGKSVSADGWTIVSNARDPEVVAQEVFNRLVAGAF